MLTRFLQGAAIFTPLDNGNIRLDEPLYHSVWLAKGVEFRVTVPRDFESDGASIPKPFWLLVGPPIRSEHLIPAIVHDYLCVKAETYQQRVLGDAVFFALLKEHGVSTWKRVIMYLGVRFYGRFVWRTNLEMENQ